MSSFAKLKMSDLPLEIIISILVRLPVKSLLRARCVSKPWRSLIDGQDFTRLHLRHSAKTNTNLSLIAQSTNLVNLDLESLERMDTGNIKTNNSQVTGSCNGLVLLISGPDKMFLWNPNTREINDLHAPPSPPEEKVGRLSERCGLGYDSKHDDYKVLSVVQAGYNRSTGVSLLSETTIYSLKTNSWKKAAAMDFPYDLTRCRPWGTYVNDALHFVVQQQHSGSEVKIMAFDLAKEEYNEVPKPASVDGVVGFSIDSMGVIGGCLVIVVVYEKWSSGEVWVMKEYGAKGSWWKLTCLDRDCVNLRPLAYSESGDEVIFNYKRSRLYWYHLGSEKPITIAEVEGSSVLLDVDDVYGSIFDAWVCVASLVSPFNQLVPMELDGSCSTF